MFCFPISVRASKFHHEVPRKFCFRNSILLVFSSSVCFNNFIYKWAALVILVCSFASSKQLLLPRVLCCTGALQFLAPAVLLGVYGAILIKDDYFSMPANTFGSFKLDILCRSVDYFFVSSKYNFQTQCHTQGNVFEIL